MKHLPYTFFLFCCFIMTNISALTVHKAGPHNQHIGYNNTDLASNGEANVVRTFIQPGYVVFDIGANKGDWSAYALSITPDILLYIFEPIPTVFRILKNNIISPSATFFNIAVSETNTTKTFFYYDKNLRFSEFSSLYRRSEDIERILNMMPTAITVSTKNLDTICEEQSLSRIDYLKIDTEGAEWEIIRGATGLLANRTISVLQFEYGGNYQDAGTTLEQIYKFLTHYDYSVFRIIPNALIYIDSWDQVLENYQNSNYIALSNDYIKNQFPGLLNDDF